MKARRLKGDTAENFVGMLESRLDAILYRANFVPTFQSARQVINHKHIMVNGKTVNIASYMVKVGDVISVKPKARKIVLIVESLEKMEREVPAYLSLDASEFSVKYNSVPKLADVPYETPMQVNLVVEYYSR